MDSARSLRTRAVMALGLMAGFYILALAVAGALLWVPYAEVMYLDRVNGRLTLFCVAGGLTILWSIVPRVDKFAPPGPRLTPANAPQLFTMINDVAAATAQERPQDVYLLNDVNAFVTHRGGFMGFGSKRVMGVGLPLIKGLSPSELRSVIAHEFGHYVSGDVALGPWIYKTRAAIGRTLQSLGEGSMLTGLFNWYARLFMRMTMQISREQEFVADATAARVAGAASAISALKRVEVIAPAYTTYLQHEVLPVLRAGFLPPIVEGFDQYLNAPGTMQAFHDYVEEVSLGAEAGEFDSHPPTADRIQALERIKTTAADAKTGAMSLMLKEADRHAKALLEHNIGRDEVTKLKTIGWSEVGVRVYAQLWEAQAKDHAKWLASLTADQLPSDRQWFEKQGNQLTKQVEEASAQYRINYAVHILSCAIGVLLLRHHWTIETAPGRPLVLVKDGVRLNVSELLGKLAAGSMPVDDWKALCRLMAIEGVALA
jgi:Zn-dependent protease with chaperone function